MEETLPEESKQMPPCDEPWDKFLSDSALALLRTLKALEEGADLDLFQPDPYFDKLRVMVNTYRGSLHSAACQRLQRTLSLGGVSVVSSADIMSLLDSLWQDSISELSQPEIIFLRRLLEDPSSSLNEVAARETLTYGRVRRAYLRMTQSGVVRMEAMLNHAELGLERMLVILENPTLVLRSEYIEHMLFVDGPSTFAYQVVTYPMDKQDDVQQYVRHMRSTAENISMFRLSTGKPRLSDFYPRHGTASWSPDMLHFRLVLRNGGTPITIGDEPPSTVASHSFTRSELQVVDIMRRDYETRAADIAHETGLSESAVFRIRQSLRTKRVVLPRARIQIPTLSERIIVTLPSDAAGDILPAWSLLPLTYVSRITNMEAKDESRILLISALPPGAGATILNILRSETSRADDLSIHVVSAGLENRMSMGALFDRQSKKFRWGQGDFFEVQSYSVVRHEARTDTIPLDLA